MGGGEIIKGTLHWKESGQRKPAARGNRGAPEEQVVLTLWTSGCSRSVLGRRVCVDCGERERVGGGHVP